MIRILESPSGSERLNAAREFVRGFPAGSELLLIGASRESVDDFARELSLSATATFGLHRFSLTQFAARIAAAGLARQRLAPATVLGVEAIAARSCFETSRRGALKYFLPVARRPGFSRAVAATVTELRLAGVRPTEVAQLGDAGSDLSKLMQDFEEQLAKDHVADRSQLFQIALESVENAGETSLVGKPILLLDVALNNESERSLALGLISKAAQAFATVPEAPILEQGSEGVRIMTVHKAKGLEFPIVILGGITAPLAHEDADCYIDSQAGLCVVQLEGLMPLELQEHQAEEAARNRAEGVRIAYVAATRARDLLVVPAVADDGAEKRFTDPKDWWIAPLFSAIFPSDLSRRKPEVAGGCPSFGRDTVLRRPADQAFNVQPIRPGKYIFPENRQDKHSRYSVVWWDPSKLGLGKEPSFAVRQEELLAKVDDAIVAEDLKAYYRWRGGHESTIKGGSQPTIRVEAASRHARRGMADAVTPAPTVVIYCEREELRPKGARFGSLVHGVLATVPMDTKPGDIEATVALQGRIYGATKEEIVSAQLAAERALAHPILRRAREAWKRGECRRETPMTLLDSSGVLVEGIVDLAFREAEHWIVVDFKTDQEVEEALEMYSRQVGLYATAVSTATGQPSRGTLMVL